MIKEFLNFDTQIAPVVLKVFYAISLFLSVFFFFMFPIISFVSPEVDFDTAMLYSTITLACAVVTRLTIEYLIMIFKIYEKLRGK